MSIQKLLAPIKRNMRLIIGKAIVKAVYDTDDEGLQKMQLSLLKNELRDRVERFQDYGLVSKPHPESEAIVLFPGGNRDRGIVIAVDDRRYRIKGLADGEVAIYTDEGDHIHLKRGNVVELKTKTFNVNADTACNIISPAITLDGKATITGATNIKSTATIEKKVTINASAEVSGELEASDCKAGGVSLKNHPHPLLIPQGVTGKPTPGA